MRRLQMIVIVSILAHGCAHRALNGEGRTEDGGCDLYVSCASGTGAADGVVSAAVVSTIAGVLALTALRWFRAGV